MTLVNHPVPPPTPVGTNPVKTIPAPKPIPQRAPPPIHGVQRTATGPTGTVANTPVDPISGLPTAQRNAYTSLQDLLTQYGLGTLAPQVLNFIKQGYTDQTSLTYLLSQTPEYKARFSGNDIRIKNGLAPLSAADYLATERSYRDVMRSSGLPSNFYSSTSDFTNLIANDISPTELQSRAQDAFNFVQNGVDPNVKAAFQQYYGVGDDHLAAYFLDPKQSEAILTQQVASSQIGGALKTAGVNVDAAHAQFYANQGTTYAQAQSGAQQAGLIKTDVENAGQRFNTPFSDADLADATVGGLASAQRAQRQLASSEAGLFGGSAGAIQQLGSNPGGAY